MDSSKAFGIVLKRLRIGARLTQAKLGGKVGYAEEHISRLENGHKSPKLATFFDLADALGISPVEFIKLIEQKRR